MTDAASASLHSAGAMLMATSRVTSHPQHPDIPLEDADGNAFLQQKKLAEMTKEERKAAKRVAKEAKKTVKIFATERKQAAKAPSGGGGGGDKYDDVNAKVEEGKTAMTEQRNKLDEALKKEAELVEEVKGKQ